MYVDKRQRTAHLIIQSNKHKEKQIRRAVDIPSDGCNHVIPTDCAECNHHQINENISDWFIDEFQFSHHNFFRSKFVIPILIWTLKSTKANQGEFSLEYSEKKKIENYSVIVHFFYHRIIAIILNSF